MADEEKSGENMMTISVKTPKEKHDLELTTTSRVKEVYKVLFPNQCEHLSSIYKVKFISERQGCKLPCNDVSFLIRTRG